MIDKCMCRTPIRSFYANPKYGNNFEEFVRHKITSQNRRHKTDVTRELCLQKLLFSE